MKKEKTIKVLFWISTIIIFLFEGVMPALTSQTELAKEGIRHLGYPDYFGVTLVVFKILGSLVLIIPAIPPRAKEWAYAGFAFDFIFAGISHWAVDGFSANVIMPLVIFGILIVSYVCFHHLLRRNLSNEDSYLPAQGIAQG